MLTRLFYWLSYNQPYLDASSASVRRACSVNNCDSLSQNCVILCHYFGEVFLRPKVAEMQIDNIGMLMLLDYGLDCLVKGEKFCLQTVVGRLLDYNGRLKEEEIVRVLGFFFLDEGAVFEERDVTSWS
ncbi:MAG: hypothetical protein K2I90_06800 [Odoribacter sp.]|nr:hypothetical protein [Odoribacter sp.]